MVWLNEPVAQQFLQFTCADPDQPAYPVWSESTVYTLDRYGNMTREDRVDVQADLSPCWLHM